MSNRPPTNPGILRGRGRGLRPPPSANPIRPPVPPPAGLPSPPSEGPRAVGLAAIRGGRGRARLLASSTASTSTPSSSSGPLPSGSSPPLATASSTSSLFEEKRLEGARVAIQDVRIIADDSTSEQSSLPPPSPLTKTPIKTPAPLPVLSTDDEGEDVSKRGPLLFKGQGGKKIAITSNYLRLKVEEGKGVFEYLVSTRPRIDSRDQMFKLVNQCKDVIGNIKTFDGRKLYLPEKLSTDKLLKTVPNAETGENVELTITFIRTCQPGDRPTIQLYNILFNRIMRILKFVEHNRKYYNPNTAHSIPTYKLQVWPGYVNAVDVFEGGLLLQCDVSHRVLRTETVRDVLVAIGKKGGNLKVEAEKALLGVSVLTKYNNKTYKIDDVDFESSPLSTFTNEKGQTLTYLEYYKKQYSLDIKDSKQPLLIHRAKKKADNEAEITKLICLIPELCSMTGMSDAMRADFKVMKEVGNYTRAAPGTRQDSILKFVKSISACPEAAQQLQNWGVRLAPMTLPLEARVLDPEILHFGKGYKEQVSPKGDWGRAATSKSVLTPIPLNKWAILFVDKNKTIVQNFCKIMTQQGPKMGIQVSNPKVISLPNDKTDTYLKSMRDIIDPSVQLVLAVFPNLKTDRYAAIKKLCCVEKPVPSQVINLKTISNDKRLSSVVQKVILQINAKLGGELWGCTTPHKDLMVVGIDVFNDKTRGNIVGVVTSLNDSLSRYYSNVAFQDKGRDILDCLKISFMEGLVKYFEANRKWPKEVVVFRDGVGDGQLETCQKFEAQQFFDAFKTIDPKNISGTNTTETGSSLSGLQKKMADNLPSNYNPGFHFIVVQKRINTRIFLKKGKDLENPPPGSILDHTVTRFAYKDFFLIPQAVNQGTVTPTHFVVIKDQGSSLDVSSVQKLAYKLTHMYYNWPGTVRVPAPCQYAHKLVDLIGEHVHKPPNQKLLDKLYYL